jgi:hypothetical protein
MWLSTPAASFVALEEFHLPEALLGFFERPVWPAQVLSFAGENLVAFLRSPDHDGISPSLID